MRIFQSGHTYPTYIARFHELSRADKSFSSALKTLLYDRVDAAHILLPILTDDSEAFYTNSNDPLLQRLWAKEHGIPNAAPDDILRAQIEDHRTEVFYDMGPALHQPDFVQRLPGSVKRRLTWWGAPNPTRLLSEYDLVLGNFPNLLREYEKNGCKTAYFFPAHDPVMNDYAANTDRPIDVLFVGSYSRHHVRRNALLHAIAALSDRHSIVLNLHVSRLTKLAESLAGQILPLRKHRRPPEIRAIAGPPLFGRDFYSAMSRSKIAINGTGEIAGLQRGNMRCFEAMGLGNLLLADDGIYPAGMADGHTLVTFTSNEDAIQKIDALLAEPARLKAIAQAGHAMIAQEYSKERQWERFRQIV